MLIGFQASTSSGDGTGPTGLAVSEGITGESHLLLASSASEAGAECTGRCKYTSAWSASAKTHFGEPKFFGTERERIRALPPEPAPRPFAGVGGIG